MPYELKLEKYQGPLDKLLELIEERKLEIIEISLAQVTDDFLVYLGKLEKSSAEESLEYWRLIIDFISIASRLIFIKSKYLLPEARLTDEEEGEIKDLERRLKLYKEFKPAMKFISKLWRKGESEFSRQYFLSLGTAGNLKLFYPGDNLDLDGLTKTFEKIFENFQGIALENETIKNEVISVEEKVREIIKKIAGIGKTSFQNLAGAKSRAEIIAFFLAILHLAREKLILLEQSRHFSDIIVRRIEEK